jgi:hypothetical protein
VLLRTKLAEPAETAESTKETPQVAIDSCPECDAPLHARREVWFTGVALGGDGSIVAATPRGDMDEVWRVYCTRGHEIAPTLIVGSRRRVPEPPETSQRVVTLGSAVNQGQQGPPRTPATTGQDSPRLAAVPPPRAAAPTMTEPETRPTPPPISQQPQVSPPPATMTEPTSTSVPPPSSQTPPQEDEDSSPTEANEALTARELQDEAEPETGTGPDGQAEAEPKHRVTGTSRTRSQRTALIIGWTLFAIGAVAIAAALVYFTIPAGHLPSFMGRIEGSTQYRRTPGVIVGAAGVVLWIVSVFAFTRARTTPGPDDLIVGFE